MKKRIYLDYAATTPVDKRVIKAMKPYFEEEFGNTATFYSFSEKTKKAVEEARQIIADSLGVRQGEIIFTGSATESANLAIKGVAEANKTKGKHIIISAIEHKCVLASAKWLEEQGFEIERIAVDKEGLVDPEDIKKAIREDTILVSVMQANNEIGTIQPIAEIGQICRERKVYFHTDATQSLGKIPVNVNQMKVDLLTASAHKIYGPKGVGFLFVKNGVKIKPIIHGGGQEFGLRSGTVNVAGIVGLGEAVRICEEEMKGEMERLIILRDKLIKGILDNISDSYLNGHAVKRLPNNINIRLKGVEGERMVISLDKEGIAVATGSACSSLKIKPSSVLLALGLKLIEAESSLRLSLGRWTTEEEIDSVLEILPKLVKKFRK